MNDPKHDELPNELENLLDSLHRKQNKKSSIQFYLNSIKNDDDSIHILFNKWGHDVKISDKVDLPLYIKKLDESENPDPFIKFLIKKLSKNHNATYASLILYDFFLLPLEKEECFHWLNYMAKTLPDALYYPASIPLIKNLRLSLEPKDYFNFIKKNFKNKLFKEYTKWLFQTLPFAILVKPESRAVQKQIQLLLNLKIEDEDLQLQSKVYLIILLNAFTKSPALIITSKQLNSFIDFYFDSLHEKSIHDFIDEFKNWNIHTKTLLHHTNLKDSEATLLLIEFIIDQILCLLKPLPSLSVKPNEQLKTTWLNWLKNPSENHELEIILSHCSKNKLRFVDFLQSICSSEDHAESTEILCMKILINYQYATFCDI